MRHHLIAGLIVLLLFSFDLSAKDTVAEKPEEIKTGSFSGRFLYEGKPPEVKSNPYYDKISLDQPIRRDRDGRAPFGLSYYRDYLRRGIRPNTDDHSLLVSKEGGIANMVLLVRSRNIPMIKSDIPETVKLEFKQGQFVPRFLSIRVGQTLIVKNSDQSVFNFHTLPFYNSAVNHIVKPKTEFKTTFRKAEKAPIEFRSDLQSWASGLILIRDDPYFAITDKDGNWSIPKLPAGKWKFSFWHEKSGVIKIKTKGRFTFEIKEGKNDFGTMKLSPDLFKKS